MARKYLTPIDLTGLELTNFKVQNLSANPTAFGKGHTYFNTVENELRTYNGSEWVSVGGKIGYGVTASRPAAGHSGAVYADTSTGTLYVDNGTSWIQIGANADDITAAIDALNTDAIEEGSTNKYFTDERAQDAVGALVSNQSSTGGSLSYNDADGRLSVSVDDQFPSKTTDNLTEGTTNLYFTNERAQDAVATAIANGSQTGISVTYDDASNAINFAVSSTPTFTTEIVFEGSTADSNQTRLQVTDPTNNDNIIILPDASGTLALTSDIPSYSSIASNLVAAGPALSNFIEQISGTSLLDVKVSSLYTELTQNQVDNLAKMSDIPSLSGYATESYVSTALYDYTKTSDLDTTVGNYGYLKSGDLPTPYISSINSQGNGLFVDNGGGLGLHVGSGLTLDYPSGIETLVVDTTLIATKGYVDSVAQGLDIKASVVLATTANITIAAGIDYIKDVDLGQGVGLNAGDRLLVKNQTDLTQNGIYVVNTLGELDRASDATFNTSTGVGTLTKGSFVFVEQGTNAGHGYVVSSILPNANSLYEVTWTQFSETGQYITSTSSEFDVTNGVLSLYSTISNKTLSDPTIFITGQLGNPDVTISGGELALLDGLTSNVQTQLDSKVRKYAQDITYASGTPTSFNIDHNLGTRECQVTVYSTSTYEEVIVDVTRSTTNRVVLDFAESPTSGAYRVVVHA